MVIFIYPVLFLDLKFPNLKIWLSDNNIENG